MLTSQYRSNVHLNADTVLLPNRMSVVVSEARLEVDCGRMAKKSGLVVESPLLVEQSERVETT